VKAFTSEKKELKRFEKKNNKGYLIGVK